MSIPSTIEQAIDRGIIHRPIDLRGDEVDLLILAAPVSAILDWIDRVPPVFSGEFHLLDLGSTKTQIVERMHSLPDRISPLGGHPMCGKETSGLSVADGDLYRDCLFALTPLDRTRPEHVEHRARTNRPRCTPDRCCSIPQQHDRAVAAISHLPYLICHNADGCRQRSSTMMTRGRWRLPAFATPRAWRLPTSPCCSIFSSPIAPRCLHALDSAQSSLQETIELIEREDWPELRAKLEAAREKRMWWENTKRVTSNE